MSSFFVNTIILVLATLGCLIVGAVILNNPPLYDPPGFFSRMKTYLTSNVAETRRDHEFPELELRCYNVAPDKLFTYLEKAILMLGWQVIESDVQQHRIQAMTETTLLKFKDDIDIQLQLADCGTELHVRSSSRVGRGDFAANTRHILDLMDALARVG